jgi:hypothetical protein
MLSRPDLSASSGAMFEFSMIPDIIIAAKRVPIGMERILPYSRMRNPINHPCVILRKSDVLAAGGYMKSPFLEDYYFWMRLLVHGYRLDNLPGRLLFFRSDNYMLRRHGLYYSINEVRFLLRLRREGIMRFISLPAYLVRILIRIMPIRIIKSSMLITFAMFPNNGTYRLERETIRDPLLMESTRASTSKSNFSEA